MTPPKTPETCRAHLEISNDITEIKTDLKYVRRDLDEIKQKLEMKPPGDPGTEQLSPQEVSTIRRLMIDRNGWVVVAVALFEAFTRLK